MDIGVTVTSEKIVLNLNNVSEFIPAENWVCVTYKNYDNGCLFKCTTRSGETNQTFLQDADYVSIFCGHFAMIPSNQLAILGSFWVKLFGEDANRPFLERFNQTLVASGRRLQVQNFGIYPRNQHQVMSILPFIDPTTLDTIMIHNKHQNLAEFDIDQIVQLDQWRQAKKVEIFRFEVSAQIQHFLHFEKAFVSFKTISVQDILQLNEAIISLPFFKSFELFYSDFGGDEQQLINVLGQPAIVDVFGSVTQVWRIDIPNIDGHFVSIRQSLGLIHFQRVDSHSEEVDLIL